MEFSFEAVTHFMSEGVVGVIDQRVYYTGIAGNLKAAIDLRGRFSNEPSTSPRIGKSRIANLIENRLFKFSPFNLFDGSALRADAAGEQQRNDDGAHDIRMRRNISIRNGVIRNLNAAVTKQA